MTTIMARYKGRVSLEVPGDVKMDPVDFKLDVGPETESELISADLACVVTSSWEHFYS